MNYATLALPIAKAAHAGQVDKAGQPYFGHPKRVAARAVELAAPVGLDLDVVEAVALLHDACEDSDLTLDDLTAAGLPAAVVGPVALLTHRKGEDRDTYLLAIVGDPVAVVTKYADTLDNTDPVRVAALPAEDAARLAAKYAGQLVMLREAYGRL
jgi:(p)ppGpp synthase/HD superfamily hydrolase